VADDSESALHAQIDSMKTELAAKEQQTEQTVQQDKQQNLEAVQYQSDYLMKDPKLAKGDQIVAIPTLVRNLPRPIRKIIGALSGTESVQVDLDFREARLAPPTKTSRT
jgi:hypothetical protein